jgi:hypothetical protein
MILPGLIEVKVSKLYFHMKKIFLIASILGSASISNVSFAKGTISANSLLTKEKSAITPQKTKVWSYASVNISCGKDMWACGESASEMLSCAIEAEQVACGG